MRKRHGDYEIEDAREQQRRQIPCDDCRILAYTEEFALRGQEAQEIHQARVLDVADELIHQRRKDAADALRDDYEAHSLAEAHAECARGVHLSALDALNAGPEDLADIGARNQAQSQNAKRVRRWPKQIPAETRKPLADQKNGYDRRQASEYIRVDARGYSQPFGVRNSHYCQNHAKNGAEHG